ncbi:Aminomethyltransferase (glycine cleavage system T protein) [hydrothermal vent metagenome]|uniref:aminomethyltransferase n=1 Tax=hydrothermal vent metagenome TaxID=652676 RepID=A0A3B1DXR0_9ZZZZ
MSQSLITTACHNWHVANMGRMVDFAGWDMPVQYSSIVEEHLAVRNAVGLFDVAHMGRIKFTGTDACVFLDHLLTNDVTVLNPGQIRYSLVCNEQGGILDDVLVYRFSSFYMLVVNASNRSKILDWIQQHRANFDVTVEDITLKSFMLAAQGPLALAVCQSMVDTPLDEIKYYHGVETIIGDKEGIVTRTGYTGEDGVELIVPSEYGNQLWNNLMQAGKERGIVAAGLGCRDTLRLEAAMPLYGHEMDESTDPFTAGLSFGVRLKAGDFIGKEALVKAKPKVTQKRIGIELEGKRIAREGATLHFKGKQIGQVTSGTFSPTLQKPIAMGYVPSKNADVGTQLEVDIRGKKMGATIVALPFYKRG